MSNESLNDRVKWIDRHGPPPMVASFASGSRPCSDNCTQSVMGANTDTRSAVNQLNLVNAVSRFSFFPESFKSRIADSTRPSTLLPLWRDQLSGQPSPRVLNAARSIEWLMSTTKELIPTFLVSSIEEKLVAVTPLAAHGIVDGVALCAALMAVQHHLQAQKGLYTSSDVLRVVVAVLRRVVQTAPTVAPLSVIIMAITEILASENGPELKAVIEAADIPALIPSCFDTCELRQCKLDLLRACASAPDGIWDAVDCDCTSCMDALFALAEQLDDPYSWSFLLKCAKSFPSAWISISRRTQRCGSRLLDETLIIESVENLEQMTTEQRISVSKCLLVWLRSNSELAWLIIAAARSLWLKTSSCHELSVLLDSIAAETQQSCSSGHQFPISNLRKLVSLVPLSFAEAPVERASVTTQPSSVDDLDAFFQEEPMTSKAVPDPENANVSSFGNIDGFDHRFCQADPSFVSIIRPLPARSMAISCASKEGIFQSGFSLSAFRALVLDS